MAFEQFRLHVIIRVVSLAGTMALFGYVVAFTSLVVTSVLLGVIVLYQILALIKYVERTNQQLTRFLEAIRHHDFSQSFGSLGLGRSFDGLTTAFAHIADDFRQTRIEREEQYNYLQTLVEHIGVGVIAYRENGDVELINHAAKRTLGINYLHTIDRLAELDDSFPRVLRNLDAGQRILVKVQTEYDTLQLAIRATKIRRGTHMLTLVSVQNIGAELADQEMAAWQNLIRVLTHEIMNSVTPIASLAGSVNDLIAREIASLHYQESQKVNSEVVADLTGALTTIERRSQGLLHFVNAYRNLTKIPRPDFRIVVIKELFDRVERLYHNHFDSAGIRFSSEITPPELELAADPDLVEQVLINLVQNSIQSLEGQETGTIALRASIGRSGRTLIETIDNGPGIVEGALDRVFIPFFTTRKSGTGIGLALARQIMHLHGGNISVRSVPNERTCFTLTF